MDPLLVGVLVALLALIGWLVLVGSFGTGIKAPGRGSTNPSRSPDEALGRLAAFQAHSAGCTTGVCVSALYEPDPGVECLGTYILIHGFTNCPAQFTAVAEKMRSQGCRVLVPRMPRHGRTDVMTTELADLTNEELTAFANEIVDIAAGFDGPIGIAGISAGAIEAAWAGAFRSEVDRLALIAPIVAPKAFPLFVVRLLIRFRRILPKLWVWWDPRLKENLGESPYVYPGFHLSGLVPYLHLAEALDDGRVEPANQLERVVLLTNPGDFAIRRDVARHFTTRAFTGHADVVAEAVVDSSLGWWHDFIDPYSKHGAAPEQVADVLSAMLGLGEDPSANGLLATPAPPSKGTP